MATVFLSSTIGNNSNSYAQAQNIATPWLTPEKSVTSAVAGDSVIFADGSYISATHVSYTKPLLNSATEALASILEAASGQGYVARISGSSPAGAYLFDGFIFQANDNVQRCFAHGSSATKDFDLTISNSQFIDPTLNCFTIDAERGSTVSTNNLYSGTPTEGGIGNAATMGADAAQSFTSTNDTLALTGVDAAIIGMNLRRSSTPLGAVTVSITGLGGTVTALATTGEARCAVTQGIEDVVISGSNLTLVSTATGVESIGLNIVGVDATANGDNGTIQNGVVNFTAPAGHAAMLGHSNADSFMAGGVINNMTVNGQFYASNSPHGLTLGKDTTGSITNSVVNDEYASFLISLTTTASVTGNTATNPYGVGFYAKGTTAATIDGNTVTIDGEQVQRELGLLTAIFQGAVDCTAVTFSNNTVLVADITAINSLAMIAQLSADSGNAQPATFTNNEYIIPDTVDLDNDLIFTRLGVSGQAANQTFTQWLANSEVTGDTVTQLPASQILDLINGTSAPTLTTPYSDLINLNGDVVSIDLKTNISGATSYEVTFDPIIPNGLTDTNLVIAGTVITPTGTAIATVTGTNSFGSVVSSFQWTTLTTGDPTSGINVTINKTI